MRPHLDTLPCSPSRFRTKPNRYPAFARILVLLAALSGALLVDFHPGFEAAPRSGANPADAALPGEVRPGGAGNFGGLPLSFEPEVPGHPSGHRRRKSFSQDRAFGPTAG